MLETEETRSRQAEFRGLLRGVLLARPKVTTQGCRRVARSAARGGLSACQSPHWPPPALSPLAPRRRPSAICHPPAAAVPATSWSICAFPSPAPGGKARPDSTSAGPSAHLRIRQCNSWCRDPPDRTTNDSHEGHQLVLQTELIDLHATKQPQGQLDTPTERSEMHLLAHFVA